MKSRLSSLSVLAVCTLLAFVLCVSYGGLLYYRSKLLAERVAAAQELLDARGERGQLASLEELLARTTAERTELDRRFVSTDDVADFLGFIETSGARLGAAVTVASVAVNAGAPSTAPDKAPVPGSLVLSLRAHGTFAQVYGFLALLTAAPYDLSVTRSDLEADAATTPGLWTGTYLVSVATISS